MSAIISPKIFISAIEKSPVVISPKVFISAVEKDPVILTPKIFISAVEKNPAIIKPKIFISAVPKNPATLKPKVFISVIDKSEKAVADTLRIVQNIFEEVATADTSRRLVDVAKADTYRKVFRIEKVSADTVIRYPYVLNFLAQDSLINTFKDFQLSLFQVTLNERTLSDSFTIETARQININDAFKGTLLDYPYSFLAEEINRQDLFSSVKGMYDIDKLLYSFIETDLRNETADDDGYYKASAYVSKIADYLGFSPNIKIEDFTPYNLIGDTNITYSDLISSLFSWTSRLPQRQINVFIRGGTLHCIQRGKEISVFDISNIPHSRPSVKQILLRSMYNSPFNNNDNDFSETTANKPFSGTISYSDTYGGYCSISYVNGLLKSEMTRTTNSKIQAVNKSTYEYTTFTVDGETQYYLKSKTTESTTIENEGVEEIGNFGGVSTFLSDQTKIVTTATTEYIYTTTHEQSVETAEDGNLYYGRTTEIYLRKEIEINTKTEYSKSKSSTTFSEVDTETNARETWHTPAGNGWYSTTVFENGEHMGSTISQGAPSNQVSLYTVQRIRNIFGAQSKDAEAQYENFRSRLAPIADVSFPVRELDLIQTLTDDLKWLNRKIQVTVSVELIDKIQDGVPTLNHIVDFTERVRLDGYEYFLVSNSVSFTPRKLIQKLQLVRWTD